MTQLTAHDRTLFTDESNHLPLGAGILLLRTGNQVVTNVPHRVVHHSPTGYEWGYVGSGPADLALNILEAVLIRIGYQGQRARCYRGYCFKLAWDLHQEYKRDVIARVPTAGMLIPWLDVKTWLQARMSDKVSASVQKES